MNAHIQMNAHKPTYTCMHAYTLVCTQAVECAHKQVFVSTLEARASSRRAHVAPTDTHTGVFAHTRVCTHRLARTRRDVWMTRARSRCAHESAYT